MSRIPTTLDYGKAIYSSGSRGLISNLSPGTRSIIDAQLMPDAYRFNTYTFSDVTLPSGWFTLSKDAGVAANFANVALAGGGALTGITGTGTGDGLSLFGAKSFTGLLNSGIEGRFNLSAITDQNQEFGFANIVTDKTLPICSDVDGTPTFGNGATEAAIFAWDTAETITTPRLCTVGVGRTAFATNYVLTNADGLPSTTAWEPEAATDYKIRIQLLGRNADGTSLGTYSGVISYAYDENMAVVAMAYAPGTASGTGVTAGGVTAATTLCPWLFQNNLAAASKTLNVKHLSTWTMVA